MLISHWRFKFSHGVGLVEEKHLRGKGKIENLHLFDKVIPLFKNNFFFFCDELFRVPQLDLGNLADDNYQVFCTN